MKISDLPGTPAVSDVSSLLASANADMNSSLPAVSDVSNLLVSAGADINPSLPAASDVSRLLVSAGADLERRIAPEPRRLDRDFFIKSAGAPVDKADAIVALLQDAKLIDGEHFLVGVASAKMPSSWPENLAGTPADFDQQLEKANAMINDVATQLKPVADKAQKAAVMVTRRLEFIKKDVRELVLTHMYSTMNDVKKLYEETTSDSSVDGYLDDVLEIAEDPTTVLPSIFAPVTLRALYSVYQVGFVMTILKLIGLSIALILDEGKQCHPERPGDIFLSPSDWLHFECYWLLIVAVQNFWAYWQIRTWKKRADEMIKKIAEEEKEEAPSKGLLHEVGDAMTGGAVTAAADVEKAVLEAKEKYDMNKDALILMDGLNGSWLTLLANLCVPLSIAWEAIAVYISSKISCANCDSTNVEIAVNAIAILFMMTLGYSLLEFFAFIFGFLVEFGFVQESLKKEAARIDDTIGVPILSILLQVFVLRKRASREEQAQMQWKRDFNILKRKQSECETKLKDFNQKIGDLNRKKAWVFNEGSKTD